MIVSRFAPAPTGFLHLGHVLNALYVWGVTRALDGRVLLRIENHDRQRSRSEYERAILDDLDWLGFQPDAPSTNAFRQGPCAGRQSDRQPVYEAALHRLSGAGLIYACTCTRRELRADMPPAPDASADAELRYSGRCASRNVPWQPGAGLRVRLPETQELFDDLRHGPQVQRPYEQCGDLLVRDRDGNWTYQFAVTVDDADQGVTLVVRGDDLLASTGRQILLARLLGRDAPPRFLHHPLLMKSPTQKLSKAGADTSVAALRAAGASQADLFGRAMFAAGFIDQPVSLSRHDAESLIVARHGAALARLREATANNQRRTTND